MALKFYRKGGHAHYDEGKIHFSMKLLWQ